jgi:GNAT superfamily N-acetyltransferase
VDESRIAELALIEDLSVAPFTALGMIFPPDDPASVIRCADEVLVEGDPPVAFAALGRLGPDAHLEQIAVHPDHGRRGHGTRLLLASFAWARAAGFEHMVLTTFRDVPWNGPWYAEHGFRELPYAECSPDMQAVRDAEIRSGLDTMAPRLAMARDLSS